MTTDNFTEAARAEAERRYNRIVRRNKTADEWLGEGRASGFTAGAEWAREHLVAEHLTKRWVCGVARSGYHNGASCRSSEPHDGWGCGYYYEASIRAPEYETGDRA